MPWRRLLVLTSLSLIAAPVSAQPDAGPDTSWESAAAFESHDPFEHEANEATDLLHAHDAAPGGADPMAVLADDDPALAAPPTEDELLEPPVRVSRGAVLEAIAGVRERDHGTSVTLAHGLAVAEETLRFTSSARHRAEVLYRLAVPPGAHLVSLEVCNEAGCRSGLTDTHGHGAGAYDDALVARDAAPSGLPVADARVRDGETTHVELRAAPVLTGRELEVRLRWVVATPVHGGTARLAIPTLGADARIAPRVIRVTSDDLVEPSVDGVTVAAGGGTGEVEVASANETVITALVPRTGGDRIELLTAPCALPSGVCYRARAVGPRPSTRGAAPNVVLAIDASPSTALSARGRITDAVRVLLGQLPSDARVSVYFFGARVESLGGASTPTEVDLEQVHAYADHDLGSATRLDLLIGALDDAHLLSASTHVVVLGDGGLSVRPDTDGAWRTARERGARLASLNVADRPSTRALREAVEQAGGLVLDVGSEAASAAGGHGDVRLTERLLVLFSAPPRSVALSGPAGSTALGQLRDGEQVVAEGAADGRRSLSAGSSSARATPIDDALAGALAAHVEARTALVAVAPADLRPEAGVCAADGSRRERPVNVASAILRPGRARVALAHRRSCALPVASERATERGLPPRALLLQLRRRVIPAARACFRDDRRGRASYSTHTDIRATLADRELTEVRVDGPITDALSSCLVGAFDGLDIPGFDGTLVVHWGLYTEAEPPPPSLELAPDLSRAVDRIGLPLESPTELLGGAR